MEEMVLGAIGYMNNVDFEKKNYILHVVSIFRLQWVQVPLTSIQFYIDEGLTL